MTALILMSLPMTVWGADIGALSVSATVLTKSNCKFSTTTGDLIFGTIDSGGTADVSATASLTFRCNGSAPIATYLISDNDGANASKMAHTTLAGNFLPYELSYTPTTGSVPRGDPVTLAITGTVRSSDYRAAMAGAYSDTVILSILP
ncbi:MAG: hypothetical protein Q7U44_12120 [Desulfuromonadales bacterium]|nr:hypothetical protein [Desulfuromonadales bacterium]